MFDSQTQPYRPTHAAARFRMPVGTVARPAVLCADVEAYVKGTTVFADDAASTANRPHALGIWGVRSWSPPV